jgi:nanoRNase/pAp phosphatase (c-di-AMP/oligoRNAs hydrolase)
MKFRLVTRSDFDGLVCAVLLKHLDLIDEILFVHPKDMQDGKIAISSRDITTNLPYVAGAHLAFDHHLSETIRNTGTRENHIIDPSAPSAARVVYDYYGGGGKFPSAWNDMMLAVDKGDSAQFNRDEVLNPQGWDLLNFLMDARTGLGRFRDFRISNYNLMMDLIDYCRTHTIDQIMALPDVKERKDLYFEHAEKCKEQIKRCSTVHKNLVVLDLRNEETIYAGNRFVIYALFPEQNISIHVLWGLKNQNTVFATGKSILNRTSKTNIGALMLEYGGGGHENAGTCQVENEMADDVLGALIARINREG